MWTSEIIGLIGVRLSSHHHIKMQLLFRTEPIQMSKMREPLKARTEDQREKRINSNSLRTYLRTNILDSTLLSHFKINT